MVMNIIKQLYKYKVDTTFVVKFVKGSSTLTIVPKQNHKTFLI